MNWRVIELLAELAERGITLRPAGSQLGVSPSSALTPELVSRIRALKAEILSLLAGPPPGRAGGRSPAPSAAERDALVALAARPGLRVDELAAATHLRRAALADALASLRARREIAVAADGRHRLVVH